ncbi:hypothetical protein [Streptomyces sp. NPDC007264]|uniref:hypothetical protein n=1 Tax=Streptomyces sp. NPDC007264 TaxID=3364777 RepID=UPI0036DD9BEB
MADEQYGWLDKDAAERLLRGEPLDAVDPDTRARAARLAEALAALAAAPAPTGEEAPGEAAALAAFRAARTGADGEESCSGTSARPFAARSADAGLIRLGRPAASGGSSRWGRRVRFGLAAAVAAGMIGGVAVAAGTGVLPTPFHDEPGPAASVSAAATSPQPLLTPTPGGPRTPAPGATSGTRNGSSHREAGDGSAPSGRPGSGDEHAAGGAEQWWVAVRSSCRDLADGKGLGRERQRALEDAAGGSARVKKFCRGVLDGKSDGQSGNGNGNGKGKGNGKSKGNGKGNGNGNGGDQGGDGEGHRGPGAGGPPLAPPDTHAVAQGPAPRTASPAPVYSALGAPGGH